MGEKLSSVGQIEGLKKIIKENREERYKFKLNYLFPPILGLAGIICMLLISRLVNNNPFYIFPFSSFEQINAELSRQVYIFPITIVTIGAIYLYDRVNFKQFFRKGEIFAESRPLKLLGIKEGDTWKKIGPAIATIVSVGTVIFMAIGVIKSNGVLNLNFFMLFPFVLIFSAANAWAEEIFTRFVIIAGLHGKMSRTHTYWISAAIFGIPHYFGVPGGIIGVLMAGFLGWLLAKSVEETRGFFWAWFIHFIQDVIIFSAMIMILLGATA